MEYQEVTEIIDKTTVLYTSISEYSTIADQKCFSFKSQNVGLLMHKVSRSLWLSPYRYRLFNCLIKQQKSRQLKSIRHCVIESIIDTKTY